LVSKPKFVPPELGPINAAVAKLQPVYADDHWMSKIWYEVPRGDPAVPEVHSYTDRMSYDPGDEVVFHSTATATEWTLQIYRDGYEQEVVHHVEAIKGLASPTPKDAYRNGCNWPVSHRWRLPDDLRSGFYRVVSQCARANGGKFVQHHFFVVRPTEKTRKAKILMVLTTATWTAYNDFGGACHYHGIAGDTEDQYSPILSLQRPWTRGLVWLPPGAPRFVAEPFPEMGDMPRYPVMEWAYSNGFAQYLGAAGWAQYDRHFLVWAEREGYRVDIITQTDLHYHPDLLHAYPCVTIVGHDEYWSREMRIGIEAYVEAGGHLARFGGNFLWQIRLEDDGRRQVCYKFDAAKDDPVRGTDQAHLLTTAWEAREVRWPGATTVGVNGAHGVYANWGGFAPLGQKGLTVYRPSHWAFAGTGLTYADVFGDKARILGYETDGLDYTFRHGLPYPVKGDGMPDSIEILAMAPAVMAEGMPDGEGFRYYVRDDDLVKIVRCLTGGLEPEDLDRFRYGSAVMVHMTRGKGEVLTAATCDWVMGLTRRDPHTRRITRNILDRFCG
jgi:hypothetical protein